MNHIKAIVNNEVKKYLIESLSQVLFNFTNLELGYKIMKSNTYYLPSVYSGIGAIETFDKNKYYMCFTRNASNLIGYAIGKKVRFEFDGNKLNQKFSGKPVNYWGEKLGGPHMYMSQTPISYTQHNNEMEDRLFSNKPVIKNIKEYINRVDILINKNDDYNCYIAKKMLIDTSFNNILFIYDNQKDFNSRNKNTINEYITNYIVKKEEEYNINGSYNKSNEKKIFFNLRDIFSNFCTYDLNYKVLIKNPTDFFVNLLKKFKLDKYVPYMERGFDRYTERVIYDTDDCIKKIHKGLKNMEEYVNIILLIEYLYKYFNINHKDFKYENLKHYSKNHNFYNYQKFYPKKINALVSEKDRICVLHPETTKCKDVNYLKDILDFKENYIHDIMKNINNYRNNDYEKFYKYLKHYINEDMTVSSLFNLYNNLDMNNKNEVFIYIPYFKEFIIDYDTFNIIKYFQMEKEEKKEIYEIFDEDYYINSHFEKLKESDYWRNLRDR